MVTRVERDRGDRGAGQAPFPMLHWRNIGPFRGGRVSAVAGHPTDRNVFFFGAASGGLWRTDDAGAYWRNVTDGWVSSASVGAVAVSEADPNVVYVGMGESTIRGNVVEGDGVYRSEDGGATWKHLGLSATRHVSRIRVHPADPDHVFVAALGSSFSHDEHRGVYRSRDGGVTWDQVLHQSPKAGAIDLAMAPSNPRVLYAALWEHLRQPWNFSSGGPSSALLRSTDGGDTWQSLSDNPGLPTGIKGRIGVAVSFKDPRRIWALVEAEERGLYRSDDGGDTWRLVSDDRALLQRPWYYSHVFADPSGDDALWVLNLRAWRSTDGGSSFREVPTPHGDNHDLWIDPSDPTRMIEGNDGGACVSLNGGAAWSTIYNQPTAQFYRMTADDRTPYRVYATQQDNTAISVPSRADRGAITTADTYEVGSSESGWVAVHPEDPDIIVSGGIGSSPGGGDSMLWYDRRTGQTRIVSVWPEFAWGCGAEDLRHRFQWTYPLLFSRHETGTLLTAGERVFRSRDGAASWEAISPDLTRGDRSKMGPSGGPLTLDTTFVENYGTLFAMAESVQEPDVLWVGSDDGRVHVTRDGGSGWVDVTPPQMPDWMTVTMIEPSPFEAGKVYVSGSCYRLDDPAPFIVRTVDHGATWERIDAGIPERDHVRVVRADTERPGMLYAGTEGGVQVSFDDGRTWRPLRLDLPVVPVHDMVVKDDELAIATHGRGFWVLDGLGLLRQTPDIDTSTPVHLLRPVDAIRRAGIGALAVAGAAGATHGYGLRGGGIAAWEERERADGSGYRFHLDAGENPQDGVMVDYHLATAPQGEVVIEVLAGASDEVIRRFTSADDTVTVPSRVGMNRFVWDMRLAPPRRIVEPGAPDGAIDGPLALPGDYRARLTVDGIVLTQPFRLCLDPRVRASQADIEAQHALVLEVHGLISAVNAAVDLIRATRTRLAVWCAEHDDAPSDIHALAEELRGRLDGIEVELIQVDAKDAYLDRIRLRTRLNTKLEEVSGVLTSSDNPPTESARVVLGEIHARIDALLADLADVTGSGLARFNEAVAASGTVAVRIPRPAATER